MVQDSEPCPLQSADPQPKDQDDSNDITSSWELREPSQSISAAGCGKEQRPDSS